jgi:hypothetical protein
MPEERALAAGETADSGRDPAAAAPGRRSKANGGEGGESEELCESIVDYAQHVVKQRADKRAAALPHDLSDVLRKQLASDRGAPGLCAHA